MVRVRKYSIVTDHQRPNVKETEGANQEGTIQINIEHKRHKIKTNKTTRCSLGAAAYCLFTCKERDIRHIRDTNLRPVLDSTPHNQQ